MIKRIGEVLILMVLLFPSAVMAHRVSVFAYQEGNQIHVEGFFSDGSPTKQATIEVYDMKGKKLFSGTTNEKGTLSFAVPPAGGKLKVVLIASMGHRAETVFELKKTKTEKAVPASAPPQAVNQETPELPAVTSGKTVGIAEKAIRAIVHEEVAKAVQPVMRALARQEAEKISFSDVIGGIGWIMGLMGIWMMMKARKK